MKNRKLFFLILTVVAPAAVLHPTASLCEAKRGGVRQQDAGAAEDKLYDGFQNPPAQARPFVRWWWNGNCVTEKEILRELDVMKDAGIGGVEINPIAMPANAMDDAAKQCTPLVWLSPEWNKMVKTAADGAKQRGMIADLIVGSGWPFGGRFLQSGEQIQIIQVNKKKLSGPGTFDSNSTALMESRRARPRRGEEQPKGTAKIVFLRLVPEGLTEFEPGADLTDRIKADGSVSFEIPDGNHTLYVGVWREGYVHVSRGAPGADGPVVNHLDKGSVRKYLDRMSDTLNPVLGGKLGNELRAMFCDSLELSGTNWTADFAKEFEKRCGYSLEPYLPFMADADYSFSEAGAPLPTDVVQGDTNFADTIRRARYDFNVTVVEMFMERFVQTYTEWCRDNGVKSRMQAYGRESHPLDTSFLVDIPECETWIWDANKTPHPTMINRYVASAAHLSGKRLISCESMTNTVTVFRILPENIKRTGDLNFLSGVTHFILHGFNYTPPEAGFPGWVQFGCYFNEKNTYWPYFRKWSDYNSRISTILQNSDAQANVALFSPDADIWSNLGRLYLPFPETAQPWYIWKLWEALHQNGYNVEYISDKILAQAKFDGGKIRYAQRAYDVIILEDVASILPETAIRLEEYAQAGGKIVFVGKAPYRSPSLKDAKANDKVVKDAIGAAIAANPKNAAVVPAPTRENIVAWAGETMKKLGVEPDVRISLSDANLSQIHHKLDDRDIFFFAYTNTEKPTVFTAEFTTGDKTPWRWNPETGNREPYPVSAANNKLEIRLEPLESLLLVFEPNMPGKAKSRPQIDFDKFAELKPTWQAEFKHGITKATFSRPLTELIDIGTSDDPNLNTFAGTITYRCEFDANDASYKMLDLGRVFGISEVALNGKSLGVRWYGRHIYDASAVLKPGKNSLEIKVTTHLGNYARSFKRNTPAGHWAWWFPIEPMGLQGPIHLLKTAPQ
jgi:hypothetical protein